jgi:hypothetical protein
MISGLAGSLRLADIPLLLPLAADYLGFRGALCEGGERVEGLSARPLHQVRTAIPPMCNPLDETLVSSHAPSLPPGS